MSRRMTALSSVRVLLSSGRTVIHSQCTALHWQTRRVHGVAQSEVRHSPAFGVRGGHLTVRGRTDTLKGMSIPFQMPSALAEQFMAEAQRRGQTPEDLIYTALQEWLHRQPPQEKISPCPQGSPEWNDLLGSLGGGRMGVVLPDDATRREAIYGDDLR